VTVLVLARDVYDAIVDHAREGAPAEVCGVLGGEGGEHARADTVLRAENVAATPRTEYAIDPAEQFDLMEHIEDRGESVVGFYHSHPAGPPRPSETDAERATWPDYSYVIAVLDGRHPYVGAWRWREDGETEISYGGRFEPEVLQVD
jgi:proteasome lid subunit RPN8/RPN11